MFFPGSLKGDLKALLYKMAIVDGPPHAGPSGSFDHLFGRQGARGWISEEQLPLITKPSTAVYLLAGHLVSIGFAGSAVTSSAAQ